jgi:hypothetical protein
MKCVALTGINKDVLDDLGNQQMRTIELRSAHNIFSIVNVNLGETIFLTSTSMHDLKPGTPGILAVTRTLDVRMHRITEQYGLCCEERETMYARVQVVLRNRASVSGVLPLNVGEPTLVEANEIVYYEAK